MQALRTDTGLMVASLPAPIVNKILKNVPGKVTQKGSEDGMEKNIFVLEGSRTIELSSGSEDIVIYLWEGFYIEL